MKRGKRAALADPAYHINQMSLKLPLNFDFIKHFPQKKIADNDLREQGMVPELHIKIEAHRENIWARHFGKNGG